MKMALTMRSLPLLIGLTLLVAGCATSAPSESSTTPVTDVSGTWVGSYRAEGGNTGGCTLILKQDKAAVGGTIQVMNVDRSFGPAPQALRGGRLVGKKLLFSATGQDGGVFRADFALKSAKVIDGWGRHTGPGYDGNVQFSLSGQ